MRGTWIVGLLIACGGHKEDRPAATPPPPATAGSGSASAPAPAGSGSAAPAAADCAARADRLGKRLHELAATVPGFLPTTRDINAPESAAAKPIADRGFIVAVTHDGKYLAQGDVLATPKAATEYLDAMAKSALEKYAMDGNSLRDAHFPLYIWADREAPAGKVAELVKAADAASDHFSTRLLVAGKGGAGPIDPNATKIPSGEPEGTRFLAEQLKAAIGACKPLIMALATSSLEGTPAKQTDKLVSEMPKGLVACECKIPDADAFEWGMAAWFGASVPPLAWIDMPKLTAGDKQPIAKVVK